ncbi:MAG: YtxH domain-containing protein [Sphingobacteriales bacterium]|nr:MAG: YtxH domain-containing protein [Sphingobacteriales bacterium]
MNKKWLALAAAGAAYYLFNTKKGNEVRQNLTKQAQNLGGKLKGQYDQYRDQAQTKADDAMA